MQKKSYITYCFSSVLIWYLTWTKTQIQSHILSLFHPLLTISLCSSGPSVSLALLSDQAVPMHTVTGLEPNPTSESQDPQLIIQTIYNTTHITGLGLCFQSFTMLILSYCFCEVAQTLPFIPASCIHSLRFSQQKHTWVFRSTSARKKIWPTSLQRHHWPLSAFGRHSAIKDMNWNVSPSILVYFWRYSICPFCQRFVVHAWPASVSLALYVCVLLCCWISVESSIYIRFPFSRGVCTQNICDCHCGCQVG